MKVSRVFEQTGQAGQAGPAGRSGADNNGLSDCVYEVMEKYFADLDGHEATDIYELVLGQIEPPLFQIVMRHSDGNLSQAARLLGLNRATLRSRLKKYGLDKK